jgi:hypothetical protein
MPSANIYMDQLVRREETKFVCADSVVGTQDKRHLLLYRSDTPYKSVRGYYQTKSHPSAMNRLPIRAVF